MPVQNSASVLGFSTIKVTVNPAPAVPTVAQSGGSNPLCQGTALTLTASSATPGATYLWSTTATTAAINIGNPGTYSVVAISNGCTSAASTPVVVTRTAKPATPTVTVTGATTFCNGFGSVTLTSSEATGNVWSTGATTQSITVTSVSGKYTVRKQTGACFSDSSDKVTVTVVDCGYAFLGTTDSDWNTASNWTTGAVPTAADSVNIWPFTANQPVIRFNDNVNVKSLCINSGATLTAEFISSIAISSGFRNNGNFVAGDYSEVDFNAGGTAKIWGTGTFDNLYLSNSTTVKLMGNMSISGVLVVSFNSVLDVNNKVLTLKATDPDNSGKIIAPFAGTIINADNTTAELMLNPANVIPAARGNWHFVAPMVTGQTMAAWNLNNPYNPGTFLPNDSTQKSSLFTYDPTYTQFQSYGGFKKPSALTDAAASGIGVRAWFTPAFYTAGAKMVQTGAPFLGNHTWDLKYCNTNCAYQAAENGYNLIGNPYAASIYWDATGLWNFNDVSSTYWIYDGKQQHYASYVQGLGGTNGATGSIAKGQSFFVKALSASAQLTVMPNATVYNAQGIMRSAAQAKMRLELTDGTYTDEVLMARKAGASRFFNGTEDAEKMWNGGVNLAFTTDKMMSISSSPVNAGDTVNLFVQSAHGNGLNLTLTETSGFDDVNTFLLDRHTGELTALTAGTTIAVASDPTGLRYALVFPASVTGVKAATNVSLNLYPNPTTDVVYIEGLTADAAKGLRLTDLLGHELNVKVNAANGRHSIDLSNLSAGLYTVRVNGKGYQVVKK